MKSNRLLHFSTILCLAITVTLAVYTLTRKDQPTSAKSLPLTSKNSTLPELPVGVGSNPMPEDVTDWIELQKTPLGWNVNGGKPSTDDLVIAEQIGRQKTRLDDAGLKHIAIVEAAPDTKMKEIFMVLRLCAKQGIGEVLLACKPYMQSPN